MSSAQDPSTVRDTDLRGVQAIVARNIEDILRLEDRRRRRISPVYRAISGLTAFCGTAGFLIANAVFFTAWIVFNQWVFEFDPYPFTFLLFAVSLEAIFLAIMILISQNMTAAEDERRHHLDLQMDLLSQRQIAALMRLTIEVAERAGVADPEIEEVKSLAHRTDPADVLDEIIRAEHRHNIDAPGERLRS